MMMGENDTMARGRDRWFRGLFPLWPKAVIALRLLLAQWILHLLHP